LASTLSWMAFISVNRRASICSVFVVWPCDYTMQSSVQ
jgi:hypothetical protein